MWNSLKVSHHPAKFGGHWYCGSGDIKILVCHVILQDHMKKGAGITKHPAKLDGHKLCGSRVVIACVCHVTL